MKRNCTVIMLLDSFKYDYLKETSFLKELAKENSSSKLETSFGFAQPQCVFTGKYPEETNKFTLFYFNPKTSPFKWVKYFYFGFEISSKNKFSNYITRRFVDVTSQKINNYWFVTSSRIPFNILHYFDIILKKEFYRDDTLGTTSIFNLLRDNNMSFRVFGWPSIHNTKQAYERTILSLKNEKHDLYYIHLTDLDSITHKFGCNSLERKQEVQRLDKIIEELLKEFQKKYKVNFVLFGDHGMIDVKYTINIQKELLSLDLRFGKDYIMFLDSTMARFWFFNDKANEIKDLKIKGGHFLTKNELINLNANFKDNRHGDLIFLADPGYLILPNYFQGDLLIKSMHGYDPKHPSQYGVFISNGNEVEKLTDIYFLLCKLLKLDAYI